MAQPKKIAAIITAYYAHSHADVLVTKFIKGFPTDDGVLDPQVTISSAYLDQVDERDIGVELLAVPSMGSKVPKLTGLIKS